MISRPLKLLFFFLSFPFCFSSVSAQLCQGSLGDPIVKFTFGYDTLGFGLPPKPLPPGITNYTFIANPCPLDGSYTISDYTAGCFGNTWYDVPQDHTPNDSFGYMMLVNATNVPGDFYTQTVTGLCGGTTYEFAAWLLNLNVPTACGGAPTKPNITFRIETLGGQVLKTYNSGDILPTSVPTWKQYGTFFTTPANTTDVVIRMTNNAPGGCGNDIALDDITFRPCGATVTASINGASTTKNVCAGAVTGTTFSGSISSPGSTTAYQWQVSSDNGATWTDVPGATASSYVPTVSATGTYLYRLTVADAAGTPASCRTISNLLTLIVDSSPVTPAFSAPDTVCISNNPVIFVEQPQNPSGTVTEWDWNFGDNSPVIQSPNNTSQSHSYAVAGTYTVTLQVKNVTGCLSTTYTKKVVITDTPTVNFTFTNSCENNPIQFTSITNAGSNVSYQWLFGDATNSSDPNPLKTYTSGTNFNVTLKITAFGCTSSITKPVSLTPKPATPSFTAPAKACVNEGVSFIYQPANPPANISQWIWNFGDNSPVITAGTGISQTHIFTTPGTYTSSLTVSAGGCLSDVFQQPIDITTNMLGTPVISLDSITSDYIRFAWSAVPGALSYKISLDGGVTFFDPSSGSAGKTHAVINLQPGQTVTIIVKAFGATSCEISSATSTATTKQSALNDMLFIPNAFTPNNDGKNDVLKVYGNNIKLITMKIFNQWGELIFATNDKDNGWSGMANGKAQPIGVYVYAVSITMTDGKIVSKKGAVNLVR